MPEKKHRVAIDTNLWISFLLTRDSAKLNRIIATDQTVLLISQELLEEIVEVAERPKFRKYFDLFELADLLIKLSQKVEVIQVRSQVDICRDAKDNFLLALTIDGAATHLLTGDKDLLVLHPFGEVQIITIADYLVNQ